MVLSLGKLGIGQQVKPATADAYASDSEPSVIHDGKLAFTRAAAGNNSKATYQEAVGAPVEVKSPLGYHVGWMTVVFLNINQMIGTGIFSTRKSRDPFIFNGCLLVSRCESIGKTSFANDGSQPDLYSTVPVLSGSPSSTGSSASSWPSPASVPTSNSRATSRTAAAPKLYTLSKHTQGRSSCSQLRSPYNRFYCRSVAAMPSVSDSWPAHT